MEPKTVSIELPAQLYADLQSLAATERTAELESLRREVHARKNLLLQIIQTFESRYECSLEELERKLENREIDEHPAWEDSIEWRNAVEQFDRIQLSESIFTWLQTLLTQSAAS
jgi:hypothetical protein